MSETETNQIIWSIHKTHPELVQSLRARLVQVVDPEIGMNIIQLGMIREVEIIDDIVKIHMILTTPFCPYGPAMIETTRKKAQEVLKLPVTVEMDMDMWDFSMMEDPSGLDWGTYM